MAEDYVPDIPIPPPNNRGFLDPFIIPPRRNHTHTMILLHGRGGDGRDFGVELITTKLLSGDTLPQRFPTTKFIFPTAKLRRSSHYHRMPTPQWFDLVNLGTDRERKDIQHQGLRESAQFVHRLIDKEAALVGPKNVVIGGHSQGAAQALHILLSYDDNGSGSLGGFVGISGWLPFNKEMAALAEENSSQFECKVESNNNYDSDGVLIRNADKHIALGTVAMNFCRQEVLNIEPLSPNASPPGCLFTPVWLAHGALDEKVAPRLGESAAHTIEKFGWDVTWMLYDELEHWFASHELDDLSIFLNARVGVPEID
ncbi:hypothetical protein LOZ58_002742 [Ophidiomyces ophidiicola]|nr:hypothetical protein LOZ65_001187 [Ophidiomyces ophidiicola]KAI1962401.1 hypothetical protein LOZ58_002742 [Ophidiomyces ophidiicola]